MIAGVVSAAAAVILIVTPVFLRKKAKSKNNVESIVYPPKIGDPGKQDRSSTSQPGSVMAAQDINPPPHETFVAADSGTPGPSVPLAGVATSRGLREGGGDGAKNRGVGNTASTGDTSMAEKGDMPLVDLGDNVGNAVALPIHRHY